MPGDTLVVLGREYDNVAGVKAYDDNGQTLTYIRPQGTKSISSNGTGIDVTEYASVDVAVPSSSPNLQAKTNIAPSTSSQTVTADNGYDGLSSVQINAMPSGTARVPSSITGTSANMSAGTNQLTFSKTIALTPDVTAGYIASGTERNASVSLTANVTTKASATIHPSTSDQQIDAITFITGNQIIKGVTTTNLLAENIKKDVVVKIGDSTDDDCVTSITGTYEGGGGGGSGVQVGTATASASNDQHTIVFSGLSGEPTSFVVTSTHTITPDDVDYVSQIVYDGSSYHTQEVRDISNQNAYYASTGTSSTYSNGTLTVTTGVTSAELSSTYNLIYTYGGSSSNIGTADVQVGSGATSITFTGLEDEPIYFSCIFKSNFSTSSGYQRVIGVAYDGTNIYGMELDSTAKYSNTHWSYTYNNGSLTISSSGTNAGGYFHQPGYYQLTYAIGEPSPYQTKSVTYTPTTSAQTATITADTGYDALGQVNVTVNAIPSQYIVPTGNIAITSNTASGSTLNVSQYATATVNVPTGGGSLSVDTKTVTASNYPVSVSFSSMKGEPKYFFLRSTSQISSSGSTTYYYIIDLRYNGNANNYCDGNCFRIGSTRRVDVITTASSGGTVTGYTWSYSGTTLTITSSAASRSASPGAFNNTYELVYLY